MSEDVEDIGGFWVNNRKTMHLVVYQHLDRIKEALVGADRDKGPSLLFEHVFQKKNISYNAIAFYWHFCLLLQMSTL